MKRNEVDPELVAVIRDQIEKMKQRIATEPAGGGMVPLELKCTMTSCKHGRHCLDHLRRPRKDDGRPAAGECRDCRQPIAKLPAVGGLKHGTEEEVLRTCVSQQSELIRAHYWQVPIDRWAYNQALRHGADELRRRVARQIEHAMDPNNAYAGRGASYTREIVGYVQHATATCCRRCASYWHGTPSEKDTKLTKAQFLHLLMVANAYIDVRLPELPAEGMSVTPIRRSELFAPGRQTELDRIAFETLSAGADPTATLVPFNSNLHIEGVRRGLLVSRQLEIASGT